MKVIELAHLDKIFSIKNKTGTNALEGGAIQENIPEKEEPSASENIDLEVSEKNASEAETTKSDNDTSQEESSPRVSRDDNNADDDKIKFKR
jgi:hypothetical protein